VPAGPDELLEVGRIGRPHGVRGEVYVSLYTDRDDRLETGARLSCHGEWLTVARSKPQGDRWLVVFEELTDRTSAERYAGSPLSAPPLDDADALWVHDLIGAAVVEADGTPRGRCVAVVQNPAADLLELESGALVPVTFVQSNVDGVITVEVPEGLFDLAADSADSGG
jgi:16S rRNA processing protein RimM